MQVMRRQNGSILWIWNEFWRPSRTLTEDFRKIKLKQHEVKALRARIKYLNMSWFSFLCVILFLSATSSANNEAQAPASEDWMRVDHSGVVSAISSTTANVPKWSGWTENFEHGRRRDQPYRSKMNSDGIELRFPHYIWGPPYADRFTITSTSPQGETLSGFVDNSGRIIIQPKYMWVEHFYNGPVAVREKKVSLGFCSIRMAT